MLFKFLPNRKKTAGELVSLKKYRLEREEAARRLEREKEAAKADFERAVLPFVTIYQRKVDTAREDFRRIEEELWNNHLRRMNGTAN